MPLRNYYCRIFIISLIALFATIGVFGQGRPRIVGAPPPSEQPENTEEPQEATRPAYFPPSPATSKRPPLSQDVVVVGERNSKKTSPLSNGAGNFSGSDFNQRLLRAIQSRIGIPYRYGSTGPNSYDCSGLVWSVFQEAGIYFERSSASTFWRNFEPPSEREKYEFGTLVFFNRLGHVGIVADENGFYHASGSKGVTYSPFAGYWEKRIVGYRKIPAQIN